MKTIKKSVWLMSFIIFFMLMTGGVISALDSFGSGKQGDNFTIVQTCSDATYITLSTMQYPDKTISVINTNMTSLGGGSYGYNFTDTIQLGRYDITGISDGCENTFANYFEVTGTGINQSVSQGIGSAIYLLLMMGLMIVFGLVGFKLTKSETLWVLGIFFMFLSVLLLVYNTWLGYEYHRTLTGLSDSAIPEIIFYIFLFLLVLGLLTSLILLFVHWKKVFKYIKTEIKRKEESKDVEDWDFKEFQEK